MGAPLCRPLLTLATVISIGLAIPASVDAADEIATEVRIELGPWVGAVSLDGGDWVETDYCLSGGFDAGGDPPMLYVYRCAFEMELPVLPGDATVTGAGLMLARSDGPASRAFPVDLGMYAGDGVASIDDLFAGTTTLRFDPDPAGSARIDVTAFIAGLLADDALWVGFRLSGPGTTDVQGWWTEATGPQVSLVLTYSVPAPSESVAPTPPATDDGASPLITIPPTDTATGASGRSGVGFLIAFALMAAGASAATVTARRPRPVRR
jgi:hypothetical protein